MKRFHFQWFDAVEWSWMRGTVIAETKEQAETFLRGTSKVRIHDRPYSGRDKECSLSLEGEENIAVPGFIDGPRKDD